MDFLCVCVRVPKCGSTSLTHLLNAEFAGRRTFYMPHTLDLDGDNSKFQEWRFWRSHALRLLTNYRTTSIAKALGMISSAASDGDLITGGHIDFTSIRSNVSRPVKMITLLREPGSRVRSEYNYCREGHLRKSYFRRLDSSLRHKAAAKYSFDGFLDFLLENKDSYGNLAARYLGWDGEESLDSFAERHIFHSGLLEESEAFEKGLSEKMGIALTLPHSNRTGGKRVTQVTAEQRRKIEAIFPRDYALYEWQRARA